MQPEITLIVAATRSMGIGFRGALPWKGLKKEMQYFARVTQKVFPPGTPNVQNAIIMGRKTWESIPSHLRPLKNRLNIIITRSAPSTPPPPSSSPTQPPQQDIRVPSIQAAIRYAHERRVSRIFIIGGETIYRAALEELEPSPSPSQLGTKMRILLTSIEEDFECDAFFPVDVSKDPRWERRTTEELKEWTGEENLPEGGRAEEAGVHYQFQMWEKITPSS